MSSSGTGAGCWAIPRPAEAARARARLPGGERGVPAAARLRLLPGPEPSVGADPGEVRGAVRPGLSHPGPAALPQSPGQRAVHGRALHHLPRPRHREDRSAKGGRAARSEPSLRDHRLGLRQVRPGDADLPAGHSGNRQATDQAGAHQNLVANPFGTFDKAPQLYENNCAQCHGATGEGGKGPPLNDQNRLGFFNDDYYYRCIYLGNTGEEHKGTIMPAWGDNKLLPQPINANINLLVHWVRMWQQYTSRP